MLAHGPRQVNSQLKPDVIRTEGKIVAAREIIIPVLLASIAVACESQDVAVCTEVSLSELAEAQWGSYERPEGWPDKSLSCAIGEYVVVTPADDSEIDHVILLRRGEPLFVQQSGVSSIFQSGRPTLDATDVDDDGLFDQLSYSVYGDDEWDEITVRDRNLDGQPDIRQYHRQGAHEYWLWVEEGWYQTPRLGSMQVLKDGSERRYSEVDGRFVFADGGTDGRITTPGS